MRSLAQVRALFALPNIGTAETGVAQGYHLIRRCAPNITEIVIRRPLEDVVQSMLALDLDGFRYEEAALRRHMAYGDRCLDRIEQRGATSLSYAALDTEAGCRFIFENCLGSPFDRDWWLQWKDVNVQVDVAAMLRYYHQHLPEITAFKRECKVELRRLVRAGEL
jgi:hypothetical protein